MFLGWLYKTTNNLDTVSVKNIVKLVDTNLNFTEYSNFEKFYFDKGKKEYEAKLEARKTRKFLESFFRDYKVNAFKTKSNYISALITLSKYLYKDITDEDEADNYEDITVIRVLRAYRRKLAKLEKQPKKITNLEFTWEEIILIREHLKKDADLIYRFCFDKKRNRTVKTKRSDRAIAVSKMKFLIFCFFTVIPPDRSRTIRELSLGNSLKYGLHTTEGFIPADKLEKREDAMFYIHLRSEDYKTGKIL